jgi:predicted peptidase
MGKRVILNLIVFSLTLTCCYANAELVENKTDEVIEGYQSFYYLSGDGQKLQYRFYNPSDKKSGKKYPLVIHFHGAGSRGDDNAKQIALAQKVTSAENIEKHPCFVFAPQCPAKKKWVDADWTELTQTFSLAPNAEMKMALAAIDEIIKEYPIDTDRVYVFGQSMGGFATWDILCRRPDMFAAAVPVCGGADENQAARIAHMPVWIFHGSRDPTVSV